MLLANGCVKHAGLARFGAFFETDYGGADVEGVSAEAAQISTFVETIRVVERGDTMADHQFMVLAAEKLGVRVVAIRWDPFADLSPPEWLVNDLNVEMVTEGNRTVVVGYKDLHFVPVLDERLSAPVGFAGGALGEDSD